MGILLEKSESTNRPDRAKGVWPDKSTIEAQPFGQLLKLSDGDWNHADYYMGVEGDRSNAPDDFAPCWGPNTDTLLDFLINEVLDEEFEEADTVVVLSENRTLDPASMTFLPATLTRILERTTWCKKEKWHAIHIPLDGTSGLDGVHYTWGAVFAIEALTVKYPGKYFILWDYDAAPTALYEVEDVIKWTSVGASLAHPEWSPQEVRPGITVVSERMSAVNAGIVYFIGRDAPPATMKKE